jgi:hypothetical protein
MMEVHVAPEMSHTCNDAFCDSFGAILESGSGLAACRPCKAVTASPKVVLLCCDVRLRGMQRLCAALTGHISPSSPWPDGCIGKPWQANIHGLQIRYPQARMRLCSFLIEISLIHMQDLAAVEQLQVCVQDPIHSAPPNAVKIAPHNTCSSIMQHSRNVHKVITRHQLSNPGSSAASLTHFSQLSQHLCSPSLPASSLPASQLLPQWPAHQPAQNMTS